MKLVKVGVNIEEWQREAALLAKINLSEMLREALNVALNADTEVQKLEQELQLEKAVIAAKEEKIAQIRQQAAQAETDERLVEDRNLWLSQHPKMVEGFKNGTISINGWATACTGLKVRNRAQAEKAIIVFIETQKINQSE